MKTKFKTIFFALTLGFYLLLFPFNSSAQNIGINATGTAPDESALLDIDAENSSSKGGLLVPRMTTAERNSIVNPAHSLLIFNTTTLCFESWNNNLWVAFGCIGSITPLFPCGGTITPVVEVTSPTGKVWMDRNLGASQVATSSTDTDAYGDYYQWGRCSDGHEKVASNTTTTQSPNETPGHSNFITGSNNWQNPVNNNLWQDVGGINNPCPTGYRLPTETEIEAERVSWGAGNQNPTGAINSPLKLPLAGFRSTNGSTINVGTYGYYWTSNFGSSNNARCLDFGGTTAYESSFARANGIPVRCIKD